MALPKVRKQLSVLAPAGSLEIGSKHINTAYSLQVELPDPGNASKVILIDRFVCNADIVDVLMVQLEICGHKRTHGFTRASLLREMPLATAWRAGMPGVQLVVMAERPIRVDCGLICKVVVDEYL